MTRAVITQRRTTRGTLTPSALLLLWVFSLLFSGAAQAARQDFTLYNSTSRTIYHLYVSRHSSSHWGSDILGSGILSSGGSTRVTFPSDEDEDYWDIKVVNSSGDAYTFYDFDLSSLSKVTLWMDADGTMHASYK